MSVYSIQEPDTSCVEQYDELHLTASNTNQDHAGK